MAATTDDKNPRPEGIISHLTGYLDTRIDIIRLETQEQVKGVFVSVVHGVALGLLGLLFVLFGSTWLGLALGDWLGSRTAGFGVLAAIYLVLLVLFFVGVDKKAFKGIADKLLNNTIYKSDKRS